MTQTSSYYAKSRSTPVLDIRPEDRFVTAPSFIAGFKGRNPEFGPVGLITYKRTYARPLPDGSVEDYWQTLERIVNGIYTVQKWHCHRHNLPWSDSKAQRSAQTMFQLMWDFKFLPGGRGLWMMGTEYVETRGSAALNNCSFTSTTDIDKSFSEPFCFLMDFSMLGVGVGGDCKGAGKVVIQAPKRSDETHVVEDTREGWVDLVHRILESYVGKATLPRDIDYSKIRAYGTPIKSFGGTAAGPEPLQRLVREIQRLLDRLVGFPITSEAIVDIFDMIGVCVVAGNVRRCLDFRQLVATENGSVQIAKVKVGDKVLTASGAYRPVTNVFEQGVQKTIRVVTDMGDIVCTPNHRVAVFTGLKNYDWKPAGELTPDDRLLSVPHTRGSAAISTDRAYLLGFYAGNGHADVARTKARNGGGGEVAFAMSTERLKGAVGQKLTAILEQLGYDPSEDIEGNDGKLRIYKKELADDLLRYKKAWGAPIVPQEVIEGTPEIRAAWLAGLADADGTTRNTIVNNIHVPFLQSVQKLCLSLGIATRVHVRRPKRIKGRTRVYEGCHWLSLRSNFSKELAQKIIQPHAARWFVEEGDGGKKNGLSLPAAFLIDEFKAQKRLSEITSIVRDSQSRPGVYRDPNYDTLIEMGLVNKSWLPLRVLGIESADEVPTYDIEVEGDHEFICEGMLVHNSAIIMFGEGDDESFLNLKNPALNKDAMNSHRWASNNSIFATVGMDYTRTTSITQKAGEPGFMWLDNARKFGRMGELMDDSRIGGFNPCAEIGLESCVLCNLVELFPSRHASYEEFERTIKFAYLYAKTVSLIPTHNMRTNAVMLRNRRIGLSQSGIVQSFTRHGRRAHFEWCDKGYGYVTRLDKMYSEWLCVPKSIKKTTVKPAGTTSLLPGVTPGIHFEHAQYYYRTIRVAKNSPLVEQHRAAGYRVEDDIYDKASNTAVIYFPIKAQFFDRGKDEISMWEQLENTAQMQKHWSDNSVSVTITFKKEEARDLAKALELYESRLKTVSFLPLEDHGYEQAPYITIDAAEYEKAMSVIAAADLSKIGHDEESTPRYCDNDKCDVRPRSKSIKV